MEKLNEAITRCRPSKGRRCIPETHFNDFRPTSIISALQHKLKYKSN